MDQIGKIDVIDEGNNGLLGVAIHPEFPDENYIYFYETYEEAAFETMDSPPYWNRVSKYQLNNRRELEKEDIIIDGIPGSLQHSGGRISFGPDKKLYVATGDAETHQSGNSSFLGGKILRINYDGSIPSDNPENSSILLFLEILPPGLTAGAHYGFVGVLVAYTVFVVVSLATSTPTEDTVAGHSRRFWNRAD